MTRFLNSSETMLSDERDVPSQWLGYVLYGILRVRLGGHTKSLFSCKKTQALSLRGYVRAARACPAFFCICTANAIECRRETAVVHGTGQ